LADACIKLCVQTTLGIKIRLLYILLV
jgi:hypothetical protein